MKHLIGYYILTYFFVGLAAQASTLHTTYQAKIIKPDGYPLQASNVNFRFSILDPSGSCVLYIEDYVAVSMADSAGLISFALGNGSRSFPASGTAQSFRNIFDNSTASYSCQTAGVYNPNPADGRKIVMQFNEGFGWQTLPAMAINAVPYAMYASKAQSTAVASNTTLFNGKSDDNFVQVNSIPTSCSSGQTLQFNGVNFSCVNVSSSGVSSVGVSGVLQNTGTVSAPVISILAASASSDGYITSADYAEFKSKISPASATSMINSSLSSALASQTLAGDVSGDFSNTQVDQVGGKTAAEVAQSVDDTQAATASATAGTIVKRDGSGNVLASGLSATTANLRYVDIYEPTASFKVRLQAHSSLSSNYVLTLPQDDGASGQVLSTDGSGNLTWISAATGSVTSVSGTYGEINSTGGLTPSLGLADIGTAGTYYKVTTDNKGRVISGVATLTLSDLPNTLLTTASNFSGDVSGLISNITVNRIQGVSVTTTSLTTNDILQFNGSEYVNRNIPICAGSQYLTFNGTSFSCVNDSGAAGVVTNVSSGNAYLTVTNPGSAPIISANVGAAANTLAAGDDARFGNALRIQGVSVIATAPTTAGQILRYNGSQWAPNFISMLDLRSTITGTQQLSSTCSVSQTLTYNSLTDSLACSAIAIATSQVSGLGQLAAQDFIDLSSVQASGTLPVNKLSDSGVVSGTYIKVTVDSKGRVTSSSVLNSGDVTTALGYTPANAASAGVTSINGSSTSAQSFAVGTTGTSFGIATAGGVHTFNIPLASAGSVTAGLLSNADYVSFSNKITSSAASIAQVLGYVPASATSLGNYLVKTNNLSDLTSSATARTNLGLGSFATANSVDLGSASATGIVAEARLADQSGVVSGTQYTKLTIDGKGRVISGAQLASSDVTTALGYTPANAASAGVTSINGSSTSAQSFSVGTAGTSFSISTAGGVHTFNIPFASVGTTTAGLISNADYTTFSNKITSSAASIAQVLGYVPASATSLGNYLAKANNLSDLASSATARANLGLGGFATISSLDLGSASATGTLAVARLPNFTGDATIAAASNTIVFSNSGVTAGTYSKVTVDAKGRVTSSSALNSGDVTTALGYTPANAASAGVTSINGSSTSAQSFSVGTAGTSFGISTAGGVHTFNIPLASAGSVTAGLLSNADYLSFSNKITSSAASIAQVLGYVPASATAMGNYLAKTNNLSDLTSSATARTNLGVGYIGTLTSVNLSSADVSGTLDIARTPSYIGDVTKAAASNTLVLSNTGVTAGTYSKVTVDSKGRVISSSALSSSDVTTALGYTPANAASAGVTSINGSSTSAQSFAVGVAGTSFGISTAGGVHTFNIPLASAGSVTAGLLSNADYTTFSNKITSSAASIAQVLGYIPASATSLSNYLVKTNNLSDLASSATARTNLGLGGFATISSLDLGSASATGTLNILRLPNFIGDATIAAASNTIVLSNSGVTAGTYSKVTVDAKGRVTSSSALNSGDVTTALGYTPANAASAGVTSINGSSTSAQSFSVGTAGTSFGISTAGGVHTFNIPLASAGSVTAGLLSNADYTTFSNKITSSAASIAQVLGYVPASATSLGNYLAKTSNLSDLASSATARLNLGLGGFATISSLDLGSASATGIIAEARLANQSGVVSGTQYTKLTIDGKGRVISGAQLASSDVTTALGYTPANAASAGVTSINGSSTSAQSFAVGTAGTSFGISTAGGVHTFNIPLASAGSVTAGLLSNADYTTFSNKITSSAASIAQVLGYTPASATALTNYVLRSNNLSDLVSATVARTNLGLGTAAVLNVGTAANNIVQLNGSALLPAIDGSLLTNLTATNITSGILSAARLPAFNGDVTTPVGSSTATVVRIQGRSVLSTAPTSGQVLAFNGTAWAPATAAGGSSQWTTSGTTINYMTGNVGIGTTAPSHALDVVDNGNDAGFKFTSFSNLYSADMRIFRARGTMAGPAALSNGDILGGLQFYGYGSAAVPAVRSAGIEAVAVENYTASARGAALAFKVASAGTTNAFEVMRINHNGNVGIGTTNPTEKLVVDGNLNISGRLSFNDEVAPEVETGFSLRRSVSGGGIVQAGGNLSLDFDDDGDGQGVFQIRQNSASPYMLISASGSVGIGTQSPSYTLDVSGTASVKGLCILGDCRTAWPSGGGSSGTVTSVSSANSYLTVLNSTSAAVITAVVGTGANTLAAGNDSRIVGALQSSNNLSDLASATVAQSNLGLGLLATLSAVNLSGTQATGTLATARLPAFAGDVTSTAGSNSLTVDGLRGVTVAATAPTSGQVLAYNGTAWTPSTLAGSSSQWNTSGTTINYTTGNVGVGTTAPDVLLDVSGTANVAASIDDAAATPVNSAAAYTIPSSPMMNVRRINLTGNATITLPTFTSPAGKMFTLTVFIKQDATGNRTLAFAGGGATIKWDTAATMPAHATAANKTTIYQFTKFSGEAVWYGSLIWKEN